MNIEVNKHTVNVITEGSGNKQVLLLHGASFQAQTWSQLGTLTKLSEQGYAAYAIDIPGFGHSQNCNIDTNEWLKECITKLNLTNPVILSPSMSGQIAIPYLINNPNDITAWIAIAPIGIQNYEAQLKEITAPVLAIWGEYDEIIPRAYGRTLIETVQNGQLEVINNGKHAAYMQHTEKFHEILLTFLEEVFT